MGDPVTPFMILLLLAGALRVGWSVWARLFPRPISIRPSEPLPDDRVAPRPPDGPDGSLPEPGARDSRLAAAQEILEREQSETQTLDEFLARPQVLEIIEWLCSSSWTAEELFTLYSGSHVLLACAATRALAQRPDGAAVVVRVLETMSRFHIWTRLLALQLLDTHTLPPAALIGPILMAIDESWSSEEGIGVLVGFARSRSARGEPLTFGEALGTATRSRVDVASQYAEKLGEVALPLRDELRAARAQLVDEVFLESFGRLWPPRGRRRSGDRATRGAGGRGRSGRTRAVR